MAKRDWFAAGVAPGDVSDDGEWVRFSAVESVYAERESLEARVRELEEYQRVAEMFQQLVIGEGAWERFQALTARAEQAEAALSVAQKDAAKHLATVYGAWTNHRSIDGNEDNQVVILTMKETNDLHDFLESIAHGGAGEGENG